VDLALCSNPQLRVAWAAIKVSVARVGQARAAYLPTLSVQLSELRNRTTYPKFPFSDSTTNGHTTYASLNWLLFDFGGRAANREAADDLLRAAIDAHNAGVQRLLAQVISDYFNAIATEATLRVSVETARLAKATEYSARRRLNQGVGNRGDLAQAATASAKADLILARDVGNRDTAMAELVYALGLAPGTPVVLPDLIAPTRPEAMAGLRQWMQQAKLSQPAIRAAHEQWAAAQAKVRRAQSYGLPTLSFVTTYDENGYPNQGLQPIPSNALSAGLTLNIPIFDGFLQRYKVSEARARAEVAQARWQDTEHHVLAQVVAAYGDAVASLDALGPSRTLLVSAQQAMEAARNRYDHGVGTMIDLLSAQAALADARRQRVQSLAQWDAARLRLLAASGVLGRSAVESADITIRSVRYRDRCWRRRCHRFSPVWPEHGRSKKDASRQRFVE
jgi:outer membrane protein